MNTFRESYIKNRDKHKRSKLRTKFILERWKVEDLNRGIRNKKNRTRLPKW